MIQKIVTIGVYGFDKEHFLLLAMHDPLMKFPRERWRVYLWQDGLHPRQWARSGVICNYQDGIFRING